MHIRLANGSELDPILVKGSTSRVQGENRDVLTFIFAGNEDLGVIDTLFTEDNCKEITITDPNGAVNVHKNYVIRGELKKKSIIITPATSDKKAVTETRIFVSMAQLTFTEAKLAEITAKLGL